MKKIADFYLPDSDNHFSQYLARSPEYQPQSKQALHLVVNDWKQVLDIGGHVGTWARWFSKRTLDLHVIEAMPDNFECLKKNMEGTSAKLYRHAISDTISTMKLYIPPKYTNSGAVSSLPMEGWAEIDMDAITVDSLGLCPTVMKLDIQGGELAALRGATETVSRSRPVICWESNEGDKDYDDIVELLTSWNYRQISRVNKDIISVPDDYRLSEQAILKLKF